MIYLDNAATTEVCAAAAEAAVYAMRKCWGNPSALYRFGIDAELLINSARSALAEALGAEPGEIFFTSGATESNNTAVFGAAQIYGKRKKRVVTTAVEHPSVAEAFKRLGQMGYDVVTVSPENGMITADALFNAVDENTCLVSAMLVNNETGHILPVGEAFSRIKRVFPAVITHCDAVQGFLKLPFSQKTLSADLISVSGHKVHAPKGIGALYVRKGVRLAPLLYGGGQQGGLRSGTEAVPLIHAFGETVRELYPGVSERLERAAELRRYAEEKLAAAGAKINSPENGSPYILSVSVEGLKSETMLHYLEARGIFVSSGSACSKGKKSAVLTAFGFGPKTVDSTLRISFCRDTQKSDIDALCEGLISASRELIKTGR